MSFNRLTCITDLIKKRSYCNINCLTESVCKQISHSFGLCMPATHKKESMISNGLNGL